MSNEIILGSVMVSIPRDGEEHVLIFRIGLDGSRKGTMKYFLETPSSGRDWSHALNDDDAIRKGMATIGKIIHDAFQAES